MEENIGMEMKREQWKLLADLFLKKDIPVFIKTISGDLHFGYIILNGEDTILVEDFSPEKRKGQRFRIFWLEIVDFQEYKKDIANSLRDRGDEMQKV